MQKYVVLILIILCSFDTHAFKSSSHSKSDTLQIISIALPPLQFYNDKHELEGYFVEVIKAAMATTSLDYDMALYPWARSYKMAQNEENVCIFSLNRIKEREQKFNWIAQLAETHSALYTLKTHNVKIRSLNEAKKYTGIAIRDGVYHQLLMRNGFEENKNVYVVGNSDALVKVVYSKRQVDFILSDDVILNRLAKKLKLDPEAFNRQFYLDITPLKDYIACSPQTSSLITNQLKQAFNTIKHNGVWENINNKWRTKLGNIIL